MQNVSQESSPDNPKIDKVNVHHDIGNLSSTPHSTSNSSPAKSETETYSEHRRYMSDSSESEEDSVSEVGFYFVPCIPSISPRGPSINELMSRDILWQSCLCRAILALRILSNLCQKRRLIDDFHAGPVPHL
jgi:hypothetical protein